MIDNARVLPLYHQVAGILRQRIEDGVYPVGGRLLAEDELAAEFDVSRATIRQAVGELVMEKLVVRRQGRGTFVEARDTKVLQQRFRGSLGDLVHESHRAKTRNLDVAHDVPFPSVIAAALQLSGPAGTVVRRTRVMDNEPFAYTVTYLPPDLGEKITVIGLRRKALMELLIDAGVVLSSATQAKIPPRKRYQWPNVEDRNSLSRTNSAAPSGPPTSVPMPPITTAISTSP